MGSEKEKIIPDVKETAMSKFSPFTPPKPRKRPERKNYSTDAEWQEAYYNSLEVNNGYRFMIS